MGPRTVCRAVTTAARRSHRASRRRRRDREHDRRGDRQADRRGPYVRALRLLDHAAWLARHGPRVLRGERVPLREPYLLHKRGRLRYEPVGVVGIVSPWNFPLGVPFTQVATAVAAGNAVVVKPSELTPSPAPGSRSSSAAPVPQGSSAWCRGRVPQRAALSSVTRASGARVHRLDRRRPHRRGAGGRAAFVPVTLELGGKGPDARPRRRRSRARRRRRLVGGVHELRPGVLGHRAGVRRGAAVRAVPRAPERSCEEPAYRSADTSPTSSSACL